MWETGAGRERDEKKGNRGRFRSERPRLLRRRAGWTSNGPFGITRPVPKEWMRSTCAAGDGRQARPLSAAIVIPLSPPLQSQPQPLLSAACQTDAACACSAEVTGWSCSPFPSLYPRNVYCDAVRVGETATYTWTWRMGSEFDWPRRQRELFSAIRIRIEPDPKHPSDTQALRRLRP